MLKKIFQNHFNLVAFILLFIVIFLLYGKSLYFDFTYYDDDVLILDRQDFLSVSNIKNIFSNTVFAQGHDKFCRPLLNVSFLIEKYLYGINPSGYHFTNIIIHLFAVFLIFIFLSLKYDKRNVFLMCLIFSCHPAVVQSVAWIPGRNDSLLALFAILSFYYFVKYFDDGKKIFFLLHILFFIIALLIKETAILIPFFYFLILLYKRQNIKTAVSYIAVWAFVIALYFAYRTFVLSYQTYSLSINDLGNNFFVSLPAITKYAANIFFPFNLSVFPAQIETNYLLSLACVLIFILLMLHVKKYSFKILIFGFLWFILFLFPTFVMPNNQYYDHRIYLPMVGIMTVLLELFDKYDKRYTKNLYLCMILMSALFFTVSYLYENKFKNKEIFWVNALIASPNSAVTNASVAGLLVERGMFKEAEEKYLKAISLEQYSKHYVNLASLYIAIGQIDKAEQKLLKALTLRDDNPMIYYYLAVVYKHKGNLEIAKQMKDLYIEIFKDTNRTEKPAELVI